VEEAVAAVKTKVRFQLARTRGPGQEPSFPRRSEIKSPTADEGRVSGDQPSRDFASTRP
jgi:hypothetical protein